MGYIDTTGHYNDTLFQYDPAQDAWTIKGPVHASSLSTTTFSMNGRGYLTNGNGTYVNSQECYEYHADSDYWHGYPQNLFFNISALSFSLNNIGYVYDGSTSVIIQFDPNSGIWQNSNSFPVQGYDFTAAFVIGQRAYLGFGFSSTITYSPGNFSADQTFNGRTNELWEYNP